MPYQLDAERGSRGQGDTRASPLSDGNDQKRLGSLIPEEQVAGIEPSEAHPVPRTRETRRPTFEPRNPPSASDAADVGHGEDFEKLMAGYSGWCVATGASRGLRPARSPSSTRRSDGRMQTDRLGLDRRKKFGGGRRTRDRVLNLREPAFGWLQILTCGPAAARQRHLMFKSF